MKIAHRTVGPEYPPLIIAEIGINHGGSLDVAKQMAYLAAESGCECIKHQTHIVDDEMTDHAKAIFPPNSSMSIWEIMETCSLSPDEEVAFKEYSESLGLIWISTPFSRAAVDFLDDIGVSTFKIGSGEADNLPLIRHIAQKNKPIIMSTGMQSIGSIQSSVDILVEYDVEFALLECTNLYPSPPEIVSLRGIEELGKAFPSATVGFSDHSIGPYMALASVALGASIVERHFTDSRYRAGPDISCSMDPSELRLLVDRSKEIHLALNNPKKRSAPEEAVYRFARASVVADTNLHPGDIITEKNIWVRRPGNGEIPGFKFDTLIGRKVKKYISKNQQLTWQDFED